MQWCQTDAQGSFWTQCVSQTPAPTKAGEVILSLQKAQPESPIPLAPPTGTAQRPLFAGCICEFYKWCQGKRTNSMRCGNPLFKNSALATVIVFSSTILTA